MPEFGTGKYDPAFEAKAFELSRMATSHNLF